MGGASAAAEPSDRGREVARNNGGKTSVFVKDFGGCRLEVTFVLWA